LFKDLEYLVETMYRDEMMKRRKTRTELEPTSAEVNRFLKEEANL